MRNPEQAHGSTPRPSRTERQRRKRNGQLGIAFVLAAIAGVMLFTPTGPDQSAVLSIHRPHGDAGLTRTALPRETAQTPAAP
jgi:hypothetical protein